jgi:hypothetical protein
MGGNDFNLFGCGYLIPYLNRNRTPYMKLEQERGKDETWDEM